MIKLHINTATSAWNTIIVRYNWGSWSKAVMLCAQFGQGDSGHYPDEDIVGTWPSYNIFLKILRFSFIDGLFLENLCFERNPGLQGTYFQIDWPYHCSIQFNIVFFTIKRILSLKITFNYTLLLLKLKVKLYFVRNIFDTPLPTSLVYMRRLRNSSRRKSQTNQIFSYYTKIELIQRNCLTIFFNSVSKYVPQRHHSKLLFEEVKWVLINTIMKRITYA